MDNPCKVGMLVEPNLPKATQKRLLDIGNDLGAEFYGATGEGFLVPRKMLDVSRLKKLDLFVVASRFLVPEPEAKRNVYLALGEPVYRYNLFGYVPIAFDDAAARAWGFSPSGDVGKFLSGTLGKPPVDFGIEFFVKSGTFVWGNRPQFVTATIRNESEEDWLPATHNVSSFWRAWGGQEIKQSARCTVDLPWSVGAGDAVTVRARIPQPPISAGKLRLTVCVRRKGKYLAACTEVPLKVLR